MGIEVRTGRDTSRLGVADWIRLVRRALRRPVLIALCGLFCVSAATAVALVKRNVYEASTEIIVRPQHIPEDFIKSTVGQDLSKILKTLTQQIMSRSRLQKIIEEFDLYPQIRRDLGTIEAIERMRSDIQVENWSSESFRISYRGTSPVVVRDVANTLASLFIQENLRVREDKARTITDYLEKELAAARKELEAIEGNIRSFQERHMGSLPSQEQAIASTMGGLMSQFQTLSEQIRSAQNRKLIISGRVRDQRRGAGRADPKDRSVLLPAELELAQARKRLEVLRRGLTEDHPDVTAAKALVSQLEAKLVAEQSGRLPTGRAAGGASESLLAELESTDRELHALSSERAALRQRMTEYEGKLSRIPRVAEQFASLRRKYEFAQSNYNDLRRKAEEARRSQQMEERQKGEQFEIVDKAVVPSQPKRPRKHEIVILGLLLGLGLGAALSFVLTFFDPTFRDPGELAGAVEPARLLVTIPRLRPPRRRT